MIIFKRKISASSNEYFFISVVLVIILISSLLLLPKIKSEFFYLNRENSWNRFLADTRNNGKVNFEKYWEMREFYSPGYFRYLTDCQRSKDVNELNNNFAYNLDRNNIGNLCLIFTSERVKSLGSWTKARSLGEIIDLSQLEQENILFIKEDEIILKKNNKAKIILIIPIAKTNNVHDFFGYQNEDDKNYVANRYWLDITSFDLN